METEDEKFESAIKRFIELGMPERHGISVNAYRKKCRRAWDACITDENYPTKLLTDHLWERYALRGFTERGYLDDSTWHSLQASEKSSKKISCVAVGRIPFSKMDGIDAPERKPPSYYLFGNDLWIVALFDVLGFEAAYQRLGIAELHRLYRQLIQKVIQAKSVPSFSAMARGEEATLVNYFHLPIGFHYFSDTILLWCPAVPEHFSPFLTRCSDLFIEALDVGLPLRGAISLGEANFSRRKQVFLGQPLIDCARLESSQDWLGVSLSSTCLNIIEHIDSDLILSYTPPVKPTIGVVIPPPLHAGLVLDWPKRARNMAVTDIREKVNRLNSSKGHSYYYENAVAFIDYSAENASWNKSEGMLVVFGALRDAIVASRKEGTQLPAWALSMIETLESQASFGASVGDTLKRAAEEEIGTAELEKLPNGPRGFLTEIESIVADSAIDLHSLAIAVVEARFGIAELSSYHRQILENLDQSKSIARTLGFLASLLDGVTIPDIPDGITKPEADILRMVSTFIRGESLPINIEEFLPAIMSAANSKAPLSEKDQRRLLLIENKGEPWTFMANAIRDVLANRAIRHPPDLLLPGEVASTIKVLEGYMAQRRGAYQATDKALERIKAVVDFDLIRTLVELLNDQEEAASSHLESILETLSTSGHPQDIVSRFVRGLRDGREDIPGGITKVVACFLSILRSGARREPILIPVEVIAELASNARARRGGDCYGLALFAILFADKDDGPALRAFCEALIASRDLPSIPERVTERTRDYLATLLRLVEVEDAWFDLGQMANVVAEEVLSGGPVDPELIEAIHTVGQGQEPFGSFGRWLYQLAVAADDVPPPVGLPKYLLDRIDVWRLACIPKCSVDTIVGLRAAVLKKRLRGEDFDARDALALRSLRNAGGSFSHLADFIRKLSRPHAMPPVPMGLPPGILSAFASARREALSREGGGLIALRPRDGDSTGKAH